jgi:hypothetical protein
VVQVGAVAGVVAAGIGLAAVLEAGTLLGEALLLLGGARLLPRLGVGDAQLLEADLLALVDALDRHVAHRGHEEDRHDAGGHPALAAAGARRLDRLVLLGGELLVVPGTLGGVVKGGVRLVEQALLLACFDFGKAGLTEGLGLALVGDFYDLVAGVLRNAQDLIVVEHFVAF